MFAGGEFVDDRLIPACAGKTLREQPSTCILRAHPRVCGENKGSGLGKLVVRGSSPRVRGKRYARVSTEDQDRLIPACAGKTNNELHTERINRAHPRVCGENSVERIPLGCPLGSSPRVRGKRGLPRPRRMVEGLIPACAGKTPINRHTSARARAHPRVCGENRPCIELSRDLNGSSPRVRGKHRSHAR